MGFVGLFKFVVKCFDILAWPLVALVYPLWASIRALEADDSSLSECRKLVAYWVLFSLIFLFEQAFDKLLQWLPFWLYMKLILTWWSVTPNFDGALYLYKHLICPCLSMDIKVLINKFNARMDFFSKSSNFEDEVKRYVKENGPEALEGFFGSSELKGRESNVVQKDVKTVQVTEQTKEVAASEQVVPQFLQEVSLSGPDICQTENKKPDTDLISNEKVEAVRESYEIPFPKQVQKEWTCTLCQVTTQSEITLNSHLWGKRHKAAYDELKAKSKNQQSLIIEDGPSLLRQRQKNYKLQGLQKKYVENKDILWWCKICNISCNSIDDMDCHLSGKKHLAMTTI
ncbi:hypothetical protein JRO89_XS09G0146600 [Xanthoceras sorbifolium]|uniref:HVA22-like protein n=1 Tax=Xanthoceras sorbifolium TaxID=99658 RepID=A0ABQ8HLL2_9ROSI|nr:hypothetical protein JRO89_XS09G0146600 [Xanthoceras sorbifolium]